MRFWEKGYYIHLGDADHLPMNTIHEIDLVEALAIVDEALNEGWPVHVQCEDLHTFKDVVLSGEAFVKERG